MRIFFLLSAVTSSLLAYTPTPLVEGAKAPDFQLMGVDGKDYSLTDFSGAQVLAVIFTTNHCPDAIASHGRMIALVDHFKDRSVKFVAINSNSPEGLHPAELGWTIYDDGFEHMKLIAKNENFNLPYLYDGATQEVAKAYGAVATPHVFIFDENLELRYNGRMDNGKRRLGPVEKNEARDAISAILAGEKIKIVKTRPVGCSTKWKEKAEKVAREDQKWKELPVSVEVADADLLASLAANEGREGLRLINLWSTSCGPCVTEFPDLVQIYRQYSWQEFEFIPISLDPVGDLEKVTRFLEAHECGLSTRTRPLVEAEKRKTNNYLFDGDTEDLAKSIDPKWDGALPYTVLIGKDGKVLFRHSGPIEPMEVKRKIVEQIWKKSE